MRSKTILRMGLAAIATIAASPSQAADCSMPPELVERICQVPVLAKLDAQLVAKERAVLAVTPRPETWAGRARSFRAWIARETDGDGKLLGSDALGNHIGEQIRLLNNELARTAALIPAKSEAAALGDTCFSKWLFMGCKVPGSGILRGDDGTRIVWQLLSGASEEDGGGMGVILWDVTSPGPPRMIGSMFEGAWMENPRYDPERGLLWVTGRIVGTGDGNADVLYQKQGGKWTEIDLGSWQDSLAARLPKGLSVTHGVDYDLTSLSAETEIWKDSDANCCATGGRANLDFEIVGATLTLKGVSAQTDGPSREWRDY